MNRWLILAATAACLGVLSPAASARPTHRHASKAPRSVCHGKSCQAPGHSSAPTSSTTAQGDSNAGDVWVDNVGQPAGPGHEMDPHLSCADINLWGDKLADATGTYTIDGWPPSGHKQQAYSSTWSYNQTQGGVQVLDVIKVQTLVANAMANGDVPHPKQGFHFKLQFSQDPQKHKTFWVRCNMQSAPPVPPGAPTTPGTTTPPASGTAPTTASGTAPAQSGVLGEKVSSKPKRKASKRSRKARRPHRAAGFTG
jgi:hypothetical protein